MTQELSRVLVTGGSGLIGVYSMRRLVEKGHQVVDYDMVPPAGERAFVLGDFKDKIVFEKAGIEDLPSLLLAVKKHRIEKIVHMAATVDPEIPHKNPSVAFRLDLGGTVNVLEAARIMDLKRVVFMSSIGVYTTKKYEPIDENHPVLQGGEGPVSTAYGACKVGGEAFCWAYKEAFGIDFVALRPSAVYGLGMGSFSLGMFVKPIVESAVKGEPLRIEHGRDYPRDYTYVKDAAQAVQLAADADPSKLRDRVFLVGTGQKLVTPGQLAETVREFVPRADVEIGPGLDEYDKREILMRGVLDISRARQQLGYEPQYDYREGMRDYIAMYRGYLDRAKEAH
jgi:nucleoside-diphosphate-sugar epimerase